MARQIILSFALLSIIHHGYALMCYQCAPSMPGCNEFNWRGMGYLGSSCPESDDVCVKLIERKGANIQITRSCLSTLEAIRTDVPADRYEGCRPASLDIRLGNYVNNSIKEYDIHRNYFDETTWCFCFLDHRCNGSSSISVPMIGIVTVAIWSTFKIMFSN
ncbi:QVR superfamily protein crim [Arctopsyche grandis]|uniref:QVR superfamily protein crim n=1 Tax=Arctopsyche grandis TaxID=121162 RepID=UPI00406D9922